MVTNELVDAINQEVQRAVDEVVKDYIRTLEDYLLELDNGTFECSCSGGVTIRFRSNHRVTATIPLKFDNGGFTWAFRTPEIEVEVDGTFEARYN